MGFFKIDISPNRIFGLDILRFFAIFFVLIGHSNIFIPEEYEWVSNVVLLDGVSIFFVLSGFLIGGILIKTVEKNEINVKNLTHFWKRRWMRTLPAYLVVLSFMFVFTWLLKPQRLPEHAYKYFFFVQNMFSPQPPFYAESWSLSIEEWFYLLVPSLLFLCMYVTKWKAKRVLPFVIVGVISAVLYYRYTLSHHHVFHNQSEVDKWVMMQIIPRLDSIMWGVLGAFLAYFYPKIWRFQSWIFLLIGITGLYILKYNGQGYDSDWNIVWMPTVKGCSTFLLLPFLSNYKQAKGKLPRFITWVSITSYSMYLLNLNVVSHVIIKFGFHGNLLYPYQATAYWAWDFAAFWILTFILSFVLYKTVELPFMRWRDKRVAEK